MPLTKTDFINKILNRQYPIREVYLPNRIANIFINFIVIAVKVVLQKSFNDSNLFFNGFFFT
mgnify:FL=1